jgi:NAD dependent epimerase/dehydratase family enzyme
MVRAVVACIDDARVSGPVNVVGPEPIRMRDFSRALGKALGRPSWAPVPGFALRAVVGEAAEVLVAGKRVLPRALETIGFEWRERDVQEAMRRAVGKAG